MQPLQPEEQEEDAHQRASGFDGDMRGNRYPEHGDQCHERKQAKCHADERSLPTLEETDGQDDGQSLDPFDGRGERCC